MTRSNAPTRLTKVRVAKYPPTAKGSAASVFPFFPSARTAGSCQREWDRAFHELVGNLCERSAGGSGEDDRFVVNGSTGLRTLEGALIGRLRERRTRLRRAGLIDPDGTG